MNSTLKLIANGCSYKSEEYESGLTNPNGLKGHVFYNCNSITISHFPRIVYCQISHSTVLSYIKKSRVTHNLGFKVLIMKRKEISKENKKENE